MSSPSRIREVFLQRMLEVGQWSSSTTGSSRDASGPSARTPVSKQDDGGAQRNSQNPAPLFPVPRAVLRSSKIPSRKSRPVDFDTDSGLTPVMAEHFGSVSNTHAARASSERTKPPQMEYPANAIAPETAVEHSIYPVNSRLRRRVPPEERTEPLMRPGPENNWDLRLNLQYHVERESDRMRAEKHGEMLPPQRPTTATSGRKSRLDRNNEHQSDNQGSEDLEKDFSMFDDTPRDQSMLTETEELTLPPWDTEEQTHDPSLSALSSMSEWDPRIDLEFQRELREGWCDCRFQVPETPADIESLQKALEMTRLDFWIRNPWGGYPDHLSEFETESYASQHRRLQHAFCRVWQDVDKETEHLALYRLPSWMFGLEECYWTPSNYLYNVVDKTYYQGLAKMAAEKNKKGLDSLDYLTWKAWLKV